MDVLKKLKKSSIRVTDIAAQYWCERQMELNYIFGAKITKEIRQGKELHKELEDEVNVPIILEPRSYPDVLYKILYTSASALDALAKNGKAREIMAYGEIRGFKLVGKIDQLEIKNGEVVVWEDKTKASDNLPSDPQLLTHKAQVMVYKRMLDNIKVGLYNVDKYRAAYRTSAMSISEQFARQLDALSVEKGLQTVDAVAGLFFERMRGLPTVSDTVCIRYLNQYTGKEIRTYRLKYDDREMHGMLEYVMKYWTGAREALPVPEAERWKCNYCAFFGKECKVWWQEGGRQAKI